MRVPDVHLEPEQIDLLKILVAANQNVAPQDRAAILGFYADGGLQFFHPGLPGGELKPNEYDLNALHEAGLIRSYDQGGKRGWRVDVLPKAKEFIASLNNSAKDIRVNDVVKQDTSPLGSDPKNEAINVLDQVINSIENGISDVEPILRLCGKAAVIVGNQQGAQFFSKEITGYVDEELPPMRNLEGVTIWRTIGKTEINDPSDTAGAVATKIYGNVQCKLPLRLGIEQIKMLTATGYWQMAHPIQVKHVPGLGGSLSGWVEAIEYYSPWAFQGYLATIKQTAYDWAVRWRIYLRYESRITDVWQRYRSSVDAKIEELKLTDHLQSIDQNLASNNMQDWRNVLYGCRSVLQDVANHLWRDERDEYPPITVKGDDGKKHPMRVTQSDYINRIQAYLHQKTTKGSQTALFESEAEYLGALFFRLNRAASHAHAGATRELAESVAIYTYVLLAELIRQTDMQPIEHYEE